MEIPDMTGMNKVISVKIRNKNKNYRETSIQTHLRVLYEIIFGVTNHKIDVSTARFLGACLVLDASESPDFSVWAAHPAGVRICLALSLKLST